jgi:hypothetical protein
MALDRDDLPKARTRDTSTQRIGAEPVKRQEKLNHHHNEVAS